jgi:NAD(P)-dependent dehydrogenase (short-subunit alcohol dehydrogenase family)
MNILLTGATSGIGFEALKLFVAEGHTVFAVGRNFSKLDSIIEKFRSQIFEFNFDLSEIENIEALFLKFDNYKFDGFVHCAGIEETLPLSLYSKSKIQSIFEINVFSAIELLRNFTKKKYSKDGASVVLLSSVMGELGQSGKIGYCATKAAILGVVKSSALEFARRKMRINAVLPGIVNTPMTEKLFSNLSESQIQEIASMHPLGFGEPKDVVSVVQFLLSVNSKWITGQSIIVDGGYSIQ